MCTLLLSPGVNPIAVNKYIKVHPEYKSEELSLNRTDLPSKISTARLIKY